MKKIRLALMDLYKGSPNQGMRCIREILGEFSSTLTYDEYEVRLNNDLPDSSFDIYISSGGPGDPLKGNGIWELKWHQLIHDLWNHNLSSIYPKKYAFFICHSFQLACFHFELGCISKRRKKSFGIMPVHKTRIGESDPILAKLPNPYYAVDSREYQIVQDDLEVFEEHHADILSFEILRTQYEDEKAIMAVRFSPEFIGTQFHPEADPEGMKIHFRKNPSRQHVIDTHGEEWYENMMKHIDDPDKLHLTHKTILPGFIKYSIEQITKQKHKILQ